MRSYTRETTAQSNTIIVSEGTTSESTTTETVSATPGGLEDRMVSILEAQASELVRLDVGTFVKVFKQACRLLKQ